MLTFPQEFLWGASTSAHQTEGNNVGSDWWAMEHDPALPLAEPSRDRLFWAADRFLVRRGRAVAALPVKEVVHRREGAGYVPMLREVSDA